MSVGDPYALRSDAIKDPPKRFTGRLAFLGPGMITSAAVVGSGELLTATALGAQAGFVLLWLVLASTFVKVWVQIELARWSISTGKGAISGYNDVPPKIAGRGWLAWISLLMFVAYLIGQADVLSASAFAFSSLLPIGGDPFSVTSIGLWVAFLVIVTIGIHVANRYAVVEAVSTVLVVLVTVFAIVMVFLVRATDFTWSLGDLADGMRLQVAVGTIGIAVAMFGLTGVGAGEITAYTYWCVEKGYATWTGPHDDSDGWAARARGWISVMKLDAWVAWVVYTASTAAFYILGAAVLHPQGLVPEGREVMTTLSNLFGSTLSTWGAVIFLLGAGVALFKTIVANVAGIGRQMGNTLAVFGVFDWDDQHKRDRWMRIIMLVLPISWGVLGTIVSSPLALVVLAGAFNAIYLMGIAVATLYLSRTQTDARVKDGPVFSVFLLISAVAVSVVGVIGLVNLFT
jgi:Mn2+/Fe2+ NRAMP family transporter